MFGRVVRTHGVHGGLRMAWLASLDALKAPPTSVRLCHRDGRTQTFAIDSVRPLGADSLVRLVGLDSPEAARAWHGADVEVDRSLVPAQARGERYLFELVGLDAVDEAGTPLGTVEAIYDHGATPLLGLRAAGNEERLVPLLDDTLRETRPTAKQVILRPLEGLW